MLKFETESSVQMLLLCSESRVASFWKDMQLLSNRSSGGGEMFSTVRRLEGVIWCCCCSCVEPPPPPLPPPPCSEPALQFPALPLVPFPPSGPRTSGGPPLESSGSAPVPLLPGPASGSGARVPVKRMLELEVLGKAVQGPPAALIGEETVVASTEQKIALLIRASPSASASSPTLSSKICQ